MPDVPLNKAEKVLGLVWRPADDTLVFNLSNIFPNNNPTPTKTELLKVTVSLYDPVGMAALITTQAKRLLRTAWSLNLGWDEPLPTGMETGWQNWLALLKSLEGVRVPRCYPGYSKATKLDLHTFVDASETTYATAVFWRSESSIGEVNVSLAAAKGRMAPLKITSIPCLELQAAVLGSRLARSVVEEHDRRPDRRVFWSDSRTVLACEPGRVRSSHSSRIASRNCRTPPPLPNGDVAHRCSTLATTVPVTRRLTSRRRTGGSKARASCTRTKKQGPRKATHRLWN